MIIRGWFDVVPKAFLFRGHLVRPYLGPHALHLGDLVLCSRWSWLRSKAPISACVGGVEGMTRRLIVISLM